jgi:hypothetical protein
MSSGDLRDELAALHEAVDSSPPPAGWRVVTDDRGFEASWIGDAGRWACVRGTLSADRPAAGTADVSTSRRLGGGWLELTWRTSDPADVAIAAATYALLDVLPGCAPQ